MRPAAIIFDFDGTILDSEVAANAALADALTAAGHATTAAESARDYMGRNRQDTAAAFAARWSAPMPDGLWEAVHRRLLAQEIAAVRGAAEFIRGLSPLPLAVASSSSVAWLRTNLARIGLADMFGNRLYSGAEHVASGKPAPDLYLHAAAALGVDPAAALAIEETPTGVRAAVAAGMTVIGLCAGGHCAPDHGESLRAAGAHHVAADYDAVARVLVSPPSSSRT